MLVAVPAVLVQSHLKILNLVLQVSKLCVELLCTVASVVGTAPVKLNACAVLRCDARHACWAVLTHERQAVVWQQLQELFTQLAAADADHKADLHIVWWYTQESVLALGNMGHSAGGCSGCHLVWRAGELHV